MNTIYPFQARRFTVVGIPCKTAVFIRINDHLIIYVCPSKSYRQLSLYSNQQVTAILQTAGGSKDMTGNGVWLYIAICNVSVDIFATKFSCMKLSVAFHVVKFAQTYQFS